MRLFFIMTLVILTGCVSTEVHQRQLSLSHQKCKIKIDDLQNKHSSAVRASEREANRKARDLSKQVNELQGKLNALQEVNIRLKETATRLVKDSDGDGLTDQRDQCVNEPEIWNGIDDHDGCPDHEPTVQVSSSQPSENSDELCTGLGCYIHAILGKTHFLEQMRGPFQAKRGFMTEREIEKIRLNALKMKSKFDLFEVCGLELEASEGLDTFKITSPYMVYNDTAVDNYGSNSYVKINQYTLDHGGDYDRERIISIDSKVIDVKQKEVYNAIRGAKKICAEVSIKKMVFSHKLIGTKHAVVGYIKRIFLKSGDGAILYQFNGRKTGAIYEKCNLSRPVFHGCNILLTSNR